MMHSTKMIEYFVLSNIEAELITLENLLVFISAN